MQRIFGTYPGFVISVDSPMKRKLGELSALAREETGGRVEGSLEVTAVLFLSVYQRGCGQQNSAVVHKAGSQKQQPVGR